MRRLELKCKAIVGDIINEEDDDFYIGFDDDFTYWMEDDTKEKLRVSSIFPCLEYDEKGEIAGLRVVAFYDVNPEVGVDIQIEEIIDYIKGQISDGWGEDGFNIDGRYVEFDYDSLDFVSDEYVEKIY